jgi:hypothetical protein
MKKKDPISEREFQGRLDLLRRTFNTELQQLRLLKTATKKRRALKRQAAENSGIAKLGKTASG